MGLDMYATSFIANAAQPQTDFQLSGSDREIFYWRKHPNLHGWMRALYICKGGQDADFNCATVLVTSDDLNRLEHALNANQLPQTTGFFFGESTPDDLNHDREFIALARAEIADGNSIAYHAWW